MRKQEPSIKQIGREQPTHNSIKPRSYIQEFGDQSQPFLLFLGSCLRGRAIIGFTNYFGDPCPILGCFQALRPDPLPISLTFARTYCLFVVHCSE